MAVEQYEAESYIQHFSQHNQTVVHEALLDEEGRLAKAAKIHAVISDFHSEPLANLACLDIGCSVGHITNALASNFRLILGIDTDHEALVMAESREPTGRFQRGSALLLPYRPNAFDVVLCNHVYEHVSDQEALFAEIWRVLRPGGFCYLAAGNRLKVVEPHYRLPFLSWLPRPIAHRYLRLTGRGRSYFEHHLTCWSLRRLVSRFEVHDYTLTILRDPRRFGVNDPLLERLAPRGLPLALLRLAYFALPTYIWILRKA
jgi:SAM-dependent methyltransferase